MLKIASDVFIRAFLLFLSLFLKIFCWVPLDICLKPSKFVTGSVRLSKIPCLETVSG